MKLWRAVLVVVLITAGVTLWFFDRLFAALALVGGVASVWYLGEQFLGRKEAARVMSPQEARLLEHSKPKEFEIRSLSFEAHLGVDIPYIEVTFYGVNYHAKRQASIQRLVVTQLSMAGRLSVVNIEGLSRTIPASSSAPIYCKKNLTEAEVRAL